MEIIEKIEQTEEQMGDPTQYVFKIPVEAVDDFGEIQTGFRKEIITKEDLLNDKSVLIAEIERMNSRITEIDSKVTLIDNY